MHSPEIFIQLFNKVATEGMPASWKTAIVTPIHKKGAKDLVSQYRPISNLNSISKLFEKTILRRLDKLGELDGRFQHGFKSARSTTTAMLEIQDFISGELDKNKMVGMYSLDLTAAFDLLRPDIFADQWQHKIPPWLLKILMDFLTDRTFKVQLKESKSGSRDLKIGCVQGSVLGPRLFTMYISQLENILPSDTFVTSYADDTYVCLSDQNPKNLSERLTDSMIVHDDFLNSIGMVTNVEKTELIYFDKKNKEGNPVAVKTQIIKPASSINVLGLQFESDLTWNKHIKKVTAKSRQILRQLRFLKKYLNQNEIIKVTTSHLYGLLYYAAPVWLNSLTSSLNMKLLNSIHYRAMGNTIGDFFNRCSRREVDERTKRSTPRQWANYCNAKMAITLTNLGKTGPRLSDKLVNKRYINDRKPGIGIFPDTSRLKIGRHSLTNRLEMMKKVSFNWTKGISTDLLRVNLKKTFFTY